MKDWMKRFLVVGLCIMLVLSLVRIQNLKEDLEQETRYLQSRIDSLEGRINSIYSEVDEMLEKEASLLTFSDRTITSINVDQMTANVEVTVIPKEYEDGVTEAVLQAGNQEYAMNMEDGSFKTEVEVPLFEGSVIDKVVFQDGSQVRTEHLGWSINPRYDVLLDVYANPTGSWTYGYGDSENTMTCNAEVRIHVDSKVEQAEIKSVHLVEIENGTVQKRTVVPADENGEYIIECKETYKAEFGTRFEIAAEVTDQYGLIYRCIVHRWESDKNGKLLDDSDWIGRPASIYSQDGKLLYCE